MHKQHKIVTILTFATLLIASFAFLGHAESNCISHCESSSCPSCICAVEATITHTSCDNLQEPWDAVINAAKFPPEKLLSAILPSHRFTLSTDIVLSKVPAITKHFQPNPLYSIIFSRAPPYFPV